MQTRLVYCVLTLIVGLGATSCAHSRKVSHSPMSNDLDRLITLSHSDKRTQWWPATRKLGRIAAADDARRDEIWERARVNVLGMKFARIEPGTFSMGPDYHRIFNIHWAHSVKLTQPYYMSVTEVTNAQFQRMFPEFKVDSKYSPDPDSPAVNVSWKDADRFCELLSGQEGVHYRLPTEAEWEYACRAGSTTRYCFGYDRAKLAEFAWWDYTNGKASPVALLKPNDWGMYDMHGNAFEWVSDWFSNSYYLECRKKGTVQDPKGPDRGRTHVLRGGGWQVRNPAGLTSTFRSPLPIFDRVPFDPDPVGLRQTIGFRVVREPNRRKVEHKRGQGPFP